MQQEPTRMMQWSTPSGYVNLSYPAILAASDVDDLEQLFALTVKIMRRRANQDAPHADR